MANEMIKNYIDAIILSTLKEETDYAYNIRKRIKEKLGFTYDLKESTLYSALSRLEKENLIEKTISEKRKYYKITIYGKIYLQKLEDDWFCTKKTIDKFLK